MRRLSWLLVVVFLAACGPGRLSSDSAESSDEGSVEDLDEECVSGCAYFEGCAPAEYDQLYPDDECVDACHGLYDACPPEAIAYFECLTALSCPEVVTLVTEGPAVTVCATDFSEAETACGR